MKPATELRPGLKSWPFRQVCMLPVTAPHAWSLDSNVVHERCFHVCTKQKELRCVFWFYSASHEKRKHLSITSCHRMQRDDRVLWRGKQQHGSQHGLIHCSLSPPAASALFSGNRCLLLCNKELSLGWRAERLQQVICNLFTSRTRLFRQKHWNTCH